MTRWVKSIGDYVAEDEPLLEVATDKVDTEIVSPHSGTITDILAREDEVVPVGGALAVVIGSVDPGPAQPTTASTHPPQEPVAAVAPEPAPRPEPNSAQAHGDPTVTPVRVLHQPAPAPPSPAPGSVTEKLPPIRRTIARRMLESLQTSAQLTPVLEVNLSTIGRLRPQTQR
ncbi:biotin/lipoyl-containing protein [Mycolicibacterium neoaurum]|uniref:biotin/lipoyl-containing protein n=1 Tax=Mycolicibacterium TaxID=1866885 RepID=UPI0027E035E4|nr:biotin/lipoyl-containing protein [Mycolicibacterium neoaurum]